MHNDIKDIEVIERAMKRLDELQRKPSAVHLVWWALPAVSGTVALVIWAAAMVVKTGGVL